MTTYDTRPVLLRGGTTAAAHEYARRARRAAQVALHETPVADWRGLTAVGGVLVAGSAGLFGAIVDLLTGPSLGTTFGIFFTLGCVVAAYKVHREDIFAAFVIPPLAYVGITLLLALFGAGGPATVSGHPRPVLVLVNALIFDAPALLCASAATGAVTSLRWAGTPSRRVRA